MTKIGQIVNVLVCFYVCLCLCARESERGREREEGRRVGKKYSGTADRSEIAPQHRCGPASVWLPYRLSGWLSADL